MLQKTGIVIIVLCMASCSADKRPDRQQAIRFRTTPPSHLYFKNTRSFHYQQSPWKNTRMDRYRLRRFSGPDKTPLLVPVILDNWMEDEAYLLFETPSGDALKTCTLSWEKTGGEQEEGKYRLEKPTPDGYTELALSIYQSLLDGHELRIAQTDSLSIPLFANAAQRSAFLTVMKDYFKLVEAH